MAGLSADADRQGTVAARSHYVIAALAFFAVLREGGETVLFLHVLAKTNGGWTAPLVSGIVTAFAGLAVLFWIIVKARAGCRCVPCSWSPRCFSS